MDAIASQITSLTIVYSTDYSDADQRKHQSSASLAFVRGIPRGPVNSPHKWPITRKMFSFDDVIMNQTEFCINCVYVGISWEQIHFQRLTAKQRTGICILYLWWVRNERSELRNNFTCWFEKCVWKTPPTDCWSLQWRLSGCGGVSNHQPHDCLLSRLFRHRSKKTSQLSVTGLCEGNSPGTGEFPTQKASNAENDSIWWRHHVLIINSYGGVTLSYEGDINSLRPSDAYMRQYSNHYWFR